MWFLPDLTSASVEGIYENIKGWRDDAKFDGEDYKDLVAELSNVKDVEMRDDYYDAIIKKIEESKVSFFFV